MKRQRTKLPGVGTQYDIGTRGGRHISVVAQQDGRRFLGFYEPDDADACQTAVPLDADEASSLAASRAGPQRPAARYERDGSRPGHRAHSREDPVAVPKPPAGRDSRPYALARIIGSTA